MADQYADPSAPVNGTGSIESPFNTFASFTWVAGNRYFIKAGTQTSEQLAIGGSGTAGARVFIGRYGDGPNPVVGVGQTNGIYAAARQYFDVESVDTKQCTGHGIYIRTSGSTIQSITLSGCNSSENALNGLYLDGVVLTATMSYIWIDDCNFDDNGQHGLDALGRVGLVWVRRCKARRNGKLAAGQGFTTHPFVSNNITSGWTLSSGSVYYRDLSSGESVQKVINRTSKVTLTQTTGSNPSADQWSQVTGTPDRLYINIGTDPNSGVTMAWKRHSHGPFFFEFNEADYNYCYSPGAGEGHGFAADDMSSDIFFRGNSAWYNEGAGIQCQWTDRVVRSGNVCGNNALSNFRTTGHTDILRDINCTSIGGVQHGFFYDIPYTTVENINCLVKDSTLNGIIAASAGITCTTPAVYGCGSGATNNVTPTDMLEINTSGCIDNVGRLLTPYVLEGIPMMNPLGAAGTYVQGVTLRNGRAQPGRTPIGAYAEGRY